MRSPRLTDQVRLDALLLHQKLIKATYRLRRVAGQSRCLTLRELFSSSVQLPEATVIAWHKLAPFYVEPVGSDYAQRVIAGEIVTSKFVRLACERQERDLTTAHERGLHFDPEAAQHVINFFGLLRHSKGEWAGHEFKPEPWQQFILRVLFGWKRADGVRRFRTAYIEIARKNGKSTLISGVGLYALLADGEAGAEVYAAATTKQQARIVFSEACAQRDASPALKKAIGKYRNNLHVEKVRAKFEPLSSDKDNLDGLNLSCGLIDELHAHKSRGLWDVLNTATGARRQPLMFAITTAGFDRHSICWTQHDYSDKILSGIVQDDTFFCFIACLDEDDDWENPANWAKANPNLGVSVKLESLQIEARQAKEMPTALNSFLRLRLNVWTNQDVRWMPMDIYDKCHGIDDVADPKQARENLLELLRGRACFGGLDLADTMDVAAWVLLFPPCGDDNLYRVLPFFFIPEERVAERSRRDRVPYDVWVREGFLIPTPGNVIDYDFIRQTVLRCAADYDLREVGFDGWNATQLSTQLIEQDGLKLEKFSQGFAAMNAPTKELMRMVQAGELAHANNPVLRWMASNCSASTDSSGNWKVDKKKSSEKVDGIIALVMAIGESMAHPENESFYTRTELDEFFEQQQTA